MTSALIVAGVKYFVKIEQICTFIRKCNRDRGSLNGQYVWRHLELTISNSEDTSIEKFSISWLGFLASIFINCLLRLFCLFFIVNLKWVCNHISSLTLREWNIPFYSHCFYYPRPVVSNQILSVATDLAIKALLSPLCIINCKIIEKYGHYESISEHLSVATFKASVNMRQMATRLDTTELDRHHHKKTGN